MAHQGTAHVVKHDRKLQRVVRDALHREVEFTSEPSAEAGSLPFVPVLPGDDFRSRVLGKEDRPRYGQRWASSAFRLSQVTARVRSWSNVARRRSSSAVCVAVSGISTSERLSHSCSMRLSRSRGDRRIISSSVSRI